MSRYADIVLPLAQPLYTFEVDDNLELECGRAVIVPFGAKSDKLYTGIVWRVHSERPNFKNIKRVERTLYARPLLSEAQQRFWEWVASYYMCTLGEVMRVALPSLMKPSARNHEELLLEEFRPREEYYVSLLLQLSDEERAHLSKRAPKQSAALAEIESFAQTEVPRRLLTADIAVLHTLARKSIISLEKRDCTLEKQVETLFKLPQLSEAQSQALSQINSSFESHTTSLLYGVTGSGKTEIYIHLIAESLAKGEDVLLLLPEIALTAQLIERMERIFGSRVVAYHSKLTQQRRTEVYLQINNRDGGNFVVGVRSAILLPLKRLKLIIVDEEHDASYKQSDTAPRYNARDCAVAIGAMQSGRTLLGSATPSLESWSNAQSGKYGLATLSERYGEGRVPQVVISDTIRSVKRGERRAHFNFALLTRLKERLAKGEQSMLFQNRRGFAPYVECEECGWSPRCPHCNVTLTLHKAREVLSCHYCGYSQEVPALCPSCEVGTLKSMGFGTERVEEQIVGLLPEARVARLDRDTVTSGKALGEIIASFESGATDILVGTQMITKGFDFSRVTLVGVLNADNMLNNPDFRSEERAFQLMTQVAGRAGRRSDGGEVVIQTSQPEHRILKCVAMGDYVTMANMLLAEREMFLYPPYSRITAITMRYKDQPTLYRGANELSMALRKIFGRRLQGPVAPAIDRIRDEYIVEMNLKIEAGASSAKARTLLAEQIAKLREDREFRNITIVVNVDPQ